MPQRKVIIIDDEKDLCLLLRDYFVRKQFAVMTAHTLQDGLQLLEYHVPDVIVLDNNLPDGTGWDIAPEMALRFRNAFIVLLSAFHPNAPVMPADTRYAVIEKPVRLRDLDMHFTKQ